MSDEGERDNNKSEYGRRAIDNGWRRWIREYGFLVVIVSAALAIGALMEKVDAQEKKIESAATERAQIIKFEQQQAQGQAEIKATLDSMQVQTSLILKVLLEGRQNNK